MFQEVDDIRVSQLQDLRPSAVLGAPDPHIVSAWTSINTQPMLTKAHRKIHRSHATSEAGLRSKRPAAVATKAAAASAAAGHGWQQLLIEYRARLLRVVKATYGKQVALLACQLGIACFCTHPQHSDYKTARRHTRAVPPLEGPIMECKHFNNRYNGC